MVNDVHRSGDGGLGGQITHPDVVYNPYVGLNVCDRTHISDDGCLQKDISSSLPYLIRGVIDGLVLNR